MSVTTVRQGRTYTRGLKSVLGRPPIMVDPWVRNPAWVSMPTVTSSDAKVVGLHAVFEGGANYVALVCTGDYTVDWGDGVTENFASGVTAYHEYSYANSALDNTNGPVTFAASPSNSTVNRTAHGFLDGQRVSFFNIVSTTGLVSGATYYVVNKTSNTFQVSVDKGGSPVTLTNDGSASTLPYKQALVVITPQAGQSLTTVNLFVKHNKAGLVNQYGTGWLDLLVGGSGLNTTGMTLSGSGSTVVQHTLLERFVCKSLGVQTSMAWFFAYCNGLQTYELNVPTVSDMSYMFNGCLSLKFPPDFSTPAVTNTTGMFSGSGVMVAPKLNTGLVTAMANMFNSCVALEKVPLYDTSQVLSMNYMFYACYSLTDVPLLNTAAVTNMSDMFELCASLVTVPLLNTQSVTNMDYMFYQCYSLQEVPLFNTQNVLSMYYTFYQCYALKKVPLFNTANLVSFSGTFNYCESLEEVPNFNLASATNAVATFYGCYSLVRVPRFNAPLLTTMQQMFVYCYRLKEIPPLVHSASATSFQAMFSGCSSLTKVPLFNTASASLLAGMFSNCSALTEVPAYNFSGATSSSAYSQLFTGCRSLTRIRATGLKYTFTVANCKLSAAALNELYTNLPTVSAQTLTVTGNPGTDTDDPTIATAKGWTVTG
jgi:hypothetical protein